jgi:putative peptidoglycan lipid II flippase
MMSQFSYTCLNLIGRVLNFALFWVILNRLGASAQSDWFFFVYGFIYFCIAVTFYSLECALVPLWPRLSGQQQTGFLKTCTQIGLLGILPLQVAGFAISLYVPSLFGFLSPFNGFHTLVLSFLLFVQPVLAYFAALYSSLLQASGRYFWPITHVTWRTVGVAAIVLLPGCLGVSCLVLAYAFGEAWRLAVLYAAAWKLGLRTGNLFGRIDWRRYRHHINALGWMALMIAASAANPYIDFIMAGHLGHGNATLVEYASRLRGLPVLALSASLVILLGDWSREQAHGLSWARIRRGTCIMGLCGLILSAGLILSQSWWVPVIFKVNSFDSGQMVILNRLIACYLVGAPFVLSVSVLSRSFMVMRQHKLLAIFSVLSVLANILLNILFIGFFGVVGIAVSTTALDVSLLGVFLFFSQRLSHISRE